jgi:hypothetical protein
MTMKPEEYRQRREQLEGWVVNVTSYRVGPQFRCTVDNADPGATIARAGGSTRDEAEKEALGMARERLQRTRRLEASLSEVHRSISELVLPKDKR